MAGENLVPSVGTILGSQPLQAAADKLSSAADKFTSAVTALTQSTVSPSRYSAINYGSSTGSQPGGNGWANRPNGGGAIFTRASGGGGGRGHGGGSQPGGNGWAGKAIGGAVAIGAAAGGVAKDYAGRHMTNATTMDYALNYFSQGTGHGIGSFTGLYQNQRFAQNSQDMTQALLTSQYTYGTAASPNNAYFTSQMRALGGSLIADPTLSAAQGAQIAAGLSGWSNYYRMRMYGLNTINKGQIMNPRAQASALTGMITQGRKFSSMNQVNATYGANSNMAWTLRNMGYDEQTIQYMMSQGRVNAIGQMNGYSSDQMTQLLGDYASGGTKAHNAAAATLKKMGIGDNMLQAFKNNTAAQTNRDANMLPGFSKGVQDATNALTDFKNALNDVMKPFSGVLGFGGGFLGTLMGAAGGVPGVGGGGGGGGTSGGGGSNAGELAGMLGYAALKYGATKAIPAAARMAGRLTMGVGRAASTVIGDAGDVLAPFFPTKIFNLHGPVNKRNRHPVMASGPSMGTSDGIVGGASSTPSLSGGGASSVATGSVGAGKNAASLLSVAARYIGVPYKWGGSSPQTGFDCSGFVQYCFGQIGVKMPRVASDQQKVGTEVSKDALQPGDLVFVGQPAHHVAIVFGNGQVIEAPHTGAAVRIRKYSPGEWTNARRVLGSTGNMATISASQTGTAAGSGTNRLGSFGLGGDTGTTTSSTGSMDELSMLSGALNGVSFSGFGMLPASPGSGTSGGTGTGSSLGASSNGNLMSILQQAGFSGNGLKMAYAIAMAESGGSAGAHNYNLGTGDNSYGLFQINMLGNLGPSRLKQYGLSGNDALLNALTNAQVAYQMSGGGSNWSAWSTYKNGAYKKYYRTGAWEIQQDETATVHKGEMILSPREADTVRNALLQNMGMSKQAGAGGDVNLHFNQGSISVVIQGGATSTSVAQNAAAEIAKALANDSRIKNIAKGKLNG